jgi:hypothetical protein
VLPAEGGREAVRRAGFELVEKLSS